MKPHPRRLSERALELVMQDVLEGLHEFATTAGLETGPGGLRILSIEPPAPRPGAAGTRGAEVVPLRIRPGKGRA
jgi:hypothetical protein